MRRYTGSRKKLFASGVPGQVVLRDRGRFRVCQGVFAPDCRSDELAVARTIQTAAVFEHLHKREIRTHWTGEWFSLGDGLVVEEASVPERESLSGHTELMAVGPKLTVRTRVSQSFRERIVQDKVRLSREHWLRDDLPELGARLQRPFVEALWKEEFEQYSASDLPQLYRWVSEVVHNLETFCNHFGAEVLDVTLSVARCLQSGEFVLIGSLSLDELTLVLGRQEYGRETLLNWYKLKQPGWYGSLQAAQRRYPYEPARWPACPPLPADIEGQHLQIHLDMQHQFDGV